MQLFITIVLLLMIGSASAHFANQRGRDPLAWFMLGILLGIFSLLVLFFLPPLKEEEHIFEADHALSKTKLEPLPRSFYQSLNSLEWFYYDEARCQQGPVSYKKLKELWDNRSLTGESYLWSEGMPNWQILREITGLYQNLSKEQS